MAVASAMKKACAMVSAYATAGFNKIHLDASMSCCDDPVPLADEEIARRAAQLCEAAEAAVSGSSGKPIYIIGTEVPTPGGAQEEMEVAVTTTASLQQTLDVHHEAFSRKALLSAWDRVIGVVVQPGVEFGNETVVDYVPEKALQLRRFLGQHEGIVFEAHSTDYQTAESLRNLISDHFGILKVGPELTFKMREAIFGLARIEEEWIAAERRSDIRGVIERVMVEYPEHWKAYYHGDESRVRFARAYSLSDRIRYYWPHRQISDALALLTQNLQEYPAPMPLIAQYLPRQADAIRAGTIQSNVPALIRHKIQESLSRYSDACGSMPHAGVGSGL
jgi:D-tagatose-1,6-bisphosphate aldolase subunit GatZ/KbaZ